MDQIVKFFGGALLTIGGIFLLIILGALCGAIAGWVVGLFFGDTILDILSQLGINGVTMWQFGAFMGFVGGFLKTKVAAEVTQKK